MHLWRLWAYIYIYVNGAQRVKSGHYMWLVLVHEDVKTMYSFQQAVACADAIIQTEDVATEVHIL